MNDSAKFNDIEGLRDNDIIITTKELAKWIKEEGIDFENLEGSKFDNMLGLVVVLELYLVIVVVLQKLRLELHIIQ